MPQGDKSSYTGKQKRKAEHIAEGYEKSGVGKKGGSTSASRSAAAKKGWATRRKRAKS